MLRKVATTSLALFLLVAGINVAQAADPFVVTFEDNDTSFVKVDFDDSPIVQKSSLVAGFDSNSTKVLKIVRGTASWAGTTIVNDASKTLIKAGTLTATAKIFSPKAGVKLMLKVENRSDRGQSVEAYSTQDAVLGWNTYTFDFTNPRPGTAGFNAAFQYNMASVFLDYTLSGPAVSTSNQAFYLDDVTFPAALPGSSSSQAVATPTLLTYESDDTLGALDAAEATAGHPQGIFGGGSAVIADAPAGGLGGKALAITKTGAPWTGLNAVVDTSGQTRYTNSQNSVVTFNFYSPKASSPIAVQLFSGGAQIELTGTADLGWSRQSFDFSTVNGWSANTVYDKVVIFPDFKIAVSAPADVYYVDDVAINGATTPPLPDTPPPPPPPADVLPSATAGAVLSGKTIKVGSILQVSKGTWSGTAPISYKYSWYRCTNKATTASTSKPATSAKCTLIAGKTSSIYRLISLDKGKYIRAMVTATNSQGPSYSTTKTTSIKVS